MANFFDQFDQPNQQPQPAGNFFDQFDAPLTPQRPAYLDEQDVVPGAIKSAGTGIAKGLAGLAGLPGLVDSAVGQGVRYLGGKLGLPEPPPEAGKPALLPTPNEVQSAFERVTGPLYKPQNRAERYIETAAEFIPAAMAGPGGLARKAIGFGIVPGVASEAAGQVTEGTAAEPYARVAGGLAAGLGAAALTRPSGASASVRRAADGIQPQQFDAAEQLFLEAQRMGLPITRAEAVQAISGGATRLSDLQRVVEGMGGMRETFAARPAQVEQASRRAFDSMAPAPTAPNTIGSAVAESATEVSNRVRGAINQAAEPFYAAASPQRLSPQEFARVQATPGWAEASNAVRRDPQLNRYVANLPDDSVGFLNEVKKYLDQAGQNAASPAHGQQSLQRAAGYSADAGNVRNAGTRTSSDYALALETQRQLRAQYLDPLLAGPIGRLAQKDLTTQKAINTLFPPNPLPNSEREISVAIRALANRNPSAARQLVRAHTESVFNEATQRLASGTNEFGGAKFAAVLRGNPQQAANLEAAVRALPNGNGVWDGFNRLLTILEAQGTRQRIGSPTAFNQEVLQDLRRGSTVSEAGTLALGAGVKLPARIKDGIERWRLGRGVDDISYLLTSPNAAGAFRQLATAPVGRASIALVARLATIAEQGQKSSGQSKAP